MSKQNYQKKMYDSGYEKSSVKSRESTNCYKCDGFDLYCTKYIPLVQEFTSPCIIKVNLKPESRLEVICQE
jgi:hypothetical protein